MNIKQSLIAIVLFIGIFYNLYADILPPYPQQDAMLSAGKWLAQNKLEDNIGSWNAGIIGYYSGGHIINLDGLVNNSIYPFIKSNRVPEYWKQEKIRYLVDFSNMFRPPFPKQGGYDRPEYLVTIHAIMRFDQGFHWWKYLSIWELN
jgi:hypothetical protein